MDAGATSPRVEEEVLTCRMHEGVDEIPAAEWDRLAGGDNPFLRHAFLSALERTGCVGPDSGWLPHHLVLFDGDRPIAAILFGLIVLVIAVNIWSMIKKRRKEIVSPEDQDFD